MAIMSACPSFERFLEIGLRQCVIERSQDRGSLIGAPRKSADRTGFTQRSPASSSPQTSTRQFCWIHVPSNISSLVPQVLRRISEDRGKADLHSKLLLDEFRLIQHPQPSHTVRQHRISRPSIKWVFAEPADETFVDGIPASPASSDEIQLSLNLPCLHWYNSVKTQKHVSATKGQTGQMCEQLVEYDELHGKSPKQGTNQSSHERAQLDTDALASSQKLEDGSCDARPTINRETVGDDNATGENKSEGDLWLWIIDVRTVITFVPQKEQYDIKKGSDIHSSIIRDINKDSSIQCADPFDFAALAVLYTIRSPFQTFSDPKSHALVELKDLIDILTNCQVSSFREFHENHRPSTEGDVPTLSRLDSHQDIEALSKIYYVKDELNTINDSIGGHQVVVEEMIVHYRNLNVHRCTGLKGMEYLDSASSILKKYKEHVHALLKSSQLAEDGYKNLLDLKYKQANKIEAHLALKKSNIAVKGSKMIIIFTVVTITFLPLSFLVSYASLMGDIQEVYSTPILLSLGITCVVVISTSSLIVFTNGVRELAQRWRKIDLAFLFWIARWSRRPVKSIRYAVHYLEQERSFFRSASLYWSVIAPQMVVYSFINLRTWMLVGVRRIIRASSWKPCKGIRVLNGEEYNIFNSIKVFVENHTREYWDWWPFRPSFRQVQPGKLRVEWYCVSKTMLFGIKSESSILLGFKSRSLVRSSQGRHTPIEKGFQRLFHK